MSLNADDKNFDAGIYQLYALVMQIIKGKSIFYYNPSELACNWRWFQHHNLTNQPQWVWHRPISYSLLKHQHNSELFVLACLSDSFNMNEMIKLSDILSHLRSVRVLIELASSSSSRFILGSKRETLARNILSFCLQSSMLNVALYFQHRTSPLTLYSFKAFPYFTLHQRRFSSVLKEGSKLYPNQLENLGGYAIRVMPDFSEPNSIMYRDESGETRITGFMWHFMESFAEKLNARLSASYPTWKKGRNLGEPYMLEFARNGTIDIGLMTVQMNEKYSKRYYQYSFPIIYGSWCIMLPRERPIEVQQIFERILEIEAVALLLFSLGCFGLSCWIVIACFPAWIRLFWHRLLVFPRLLALLVLCACEAQLLAYMILCPLQTPIHSFDELLDSSLRIFGLRAEFDSLDHSFRARYASAFRLTSNLSEMFHMRNNFNTSWAYSITTIKWHVMEAQQRYFQQPLFRYSDLCLSQSFPYSILVADESIYKEALMLHSMLVQQSGLIYHWLKHGFNDMVTAGLMQLKDFSPQNQWQNLTMQDLNFAWRCCATGLLVALIVFLVELLRFYVNVWLDSL